MLNKSLFQEWMAPERPRPSECSLLKRRLRAETRISQDSEWRRLVECHLPHSKQYKVCGIAIYKIVIVTLSSHCCFCYLFIACIDTCILGKRKIEFRDVDCIFFRIGARPASTLATARSSMRCWRYVSLSKYSSEDETFLMLTSLLEKKNKVKSLLFSSELLSLEKTEQLCFPHLILFLSYSLQEMSGEETLRMFARIRGIPKNEIERVS